MPLVAAGLSAAIKAELDAASPTSATDDGAVDGAAQRQQFADALAAAIVTYIKANALVTVASVTGVTTGAGVSGPGQGTLS